MSFIDHRPFNIPSVRLSFQKVGARLKKLLSSWSATTQQNNQQAYYLPAPSQPLLLAPPPAPIKERIEIETPNLTANGYRSFVPNAQHTVVLSLGHGDTYKDYHWLTQYLNLSKINVAILELLPPENSTKYKNGLDIVEGYREIISAGLLTPTSPLFDKIPSHHQVSLLTHSSSGLAFELETLSCKEKARFARDFFKEVSPVSPMFDTAGSSELFHPYISTAYNLYGTSILARDFNVGKAPLDIVYLKPKAWLRGAKPSKVSETAALHPQGVALKQAGITYRKNLEAKIKSGQLTDDHPYRQIERYFITGRFDDAACHQTTEYIANLIGASHQNYPTGHMPPCQIKEARFDTLSIIKKGTLLDNVIVMQQPRQQETTPRTLPVSVDKQHAVHLQM